MNVLIMGETSGKIRDAFIARGHNAWSCDLLPSKGKSLGQHFPDLYPAGHQLHAFQQHHQCDVRELFSGRVAHSMALEGQRVRWDLLIAHPHCTYLTNSAAWAFSDPDYVKYPNVGYHQKVKPDTLVGAARRAARQEALAFVEWLWRLPIKKKALENPQGCINTRLPFMPRPCVIQPHMFGEDASKGTCLWLDNLPPLVQTKHIAPRMVCCGMVIENGDKYGCPNCNGDKVARPRWGNQTDSGQNRLSPSDDRWSKRSETFAGIAEAMADQWGSPQTTRDTQP